MSDDLKPCPFCKTILPYETIINDSIGEVHIIRCQQCSAKITVRETAYDRSSGEREPTGHTAEKVWNTRAADAEIAALRAERDALRLSLDESVKELARTVQQMNELNRSYAELKAHSTGNLTVTMRERDRLQQQIAALTREPDEAEVEAAAKEVHQVDELALSWKESREGYRNHCRDLARAAIAAFIAGRRK